MRVHIEIDDDVSVESSRDERRPFEDAIEVVDAGGPPAELLRSLGADVPVSGARDDAVDAGPAPDA